MLNSTIYLWIKESLKIIEKTYKYVKLVGPIHIMTQKNLYINLGHFHNYCQVISRL